MFYSRHSYLSLPTKPGVYIFLDENSNILYVGKAKDLKARVSSYFTSPTQLGEKTRVLVSQIDKIDITVVESELESLLLEAFLIKKHMPRYNIRMTDGKAYPLIEITMEDVYPAILTARRPTNKKSLYFGPYPSAGAVRLVLKTIRRIFPFLSTRNHAKRICLYHHLGLCPCPPVFDSPELKKTYRQNMRQIVRILEGKSQAVLKDLEKEREQESKKEHYEEAARLQKSIDALQYITQPFRQPFEYDTNPNLRTDIRLEELQELMQILGTAGYSLTSLHKIECYDISHIQGTNTTASLVVLIDGEIEKSLYRKFKIQSLRKRGDIPPLSRPDLVGTRKRTQSHQAPSVPDDFASMQEVLKRRLKHTEWDYPDLIVVDGGKGQVSSALETLTELGLSIPLIGLAKREETIIVPLDHPLVNRDKVIDSQTRFTGAYHKSAEEAPFQEISLPKSTKALHLIMRIRDEAHRFAITYHRKLRSKEFTG